MFLRNFGTSLHGAKIQKNIIIIILLSFVLFSFFIFHFSFPSVCIYLFYSSFIFFLFSFISFFSFPFSILSVSFCSLPSCFFYYSLVFFSFSLSFSICLFISFSLPIHLFSYSHRSLQLFSVIPHARYILINARSINYVARFSCFNRDGLLYWPHFIASQSQAGDRTLINWLACRISGVDPPRDHTLLPAEWRSEFVLSCWLVWPVAHFSGYGALMKHQCIYDIISYFAVTCLLNVFHHI
jgi:hypothetical protein